MIGARYYTVRRQGVRLDLGLWEPYGAPRTFRILAALQTSSPLAASMRQDGVRAEAAAVLLVPLDQPELQPGMQGAPHRADVVTDGHREWTVVSRANYTTAGGVPHRDYNLTELQPETARVTP
jgi:hypothetical protein